VGTWVASYPRRDILDRLMELWQEPWSEPAFGEAQMLLARLRHSQPVPTHEPPAAPIGLRAKVGKVFDTGEGQRAIDRETGAYGGPASVPEAEPLDRWVQHDEYCPAIGAKGECNCGLTDALAAYRASVPAPGLRRWAESLLTHAERDGLVWVTKAEVRAALAATPPPALDVERLTIENCIYYVQQSLDTVRGEDDGESRTIKASIAAREHVIALLTGYRDRVAATPPTDDTPCEHLIPARECRIVGCRGASTDTPEAER
jgi:hypothetical protein